MPRHLNDTPSTKTNFIFNSTMSQEESDKCSPSLVSAFKETLFGLIENHYPHVPNPESCKKRASVALILRVRPEYSHWPESCFSKEGENANLSTAESLEQFFVQDWVQHGDPESVFIKRAARVGDRWTSQYVGFCSCIVARS